MSTRAKLMTTYFAAMLGLSLLNILMNVVPSTLSDNATEIMFTLLSQVVCMGVIPLVGAALSKPRKGVDLATYCRTWTANWRYRMPNPKVWLAVVPLAFSFFYVTQPVARLNVLWLSLVGFSFSIAPATIYGGGGDLVLWIFLGAMLPAIFEELTHRGLVLDAALDRGSEVSMVVLSGLLFALMHTNIMQFLFAFAGGCVFAFITIKTKSIYPAMLMHFTNNALSHIQSYSAQHPDGLLGFVYTIDSFFQDTVVGLLCSIVLLVGNVFLFAWLVAMVQKWSGHAEGLEEKWIFKGKRTDAFAISIDTYRPFGKASLSDNLPMIAAIVMMACMTIFTFVWGMIR